MKSNKRSILKSLSFLGGLGVVLPNMWTKPLINVALLPVHAMTSCSKIVDITPHRPGGSACTLPTQGWQQCFLQLRNDGCKTVQIRGSQASDSISFANWTLDNALTFPYEFKPGDILNLTIQADRLYPCLDNGGLIVTLTLFTNEGEAVFSCARSELFV